MSEGTPWRPRASHAVVAAAFLLVGIDVGLRLAPRDPPAPAAQGAAPPPGARAEGAAPPPGARPAEQTSPRNATDRSLRAMPSPVVVEPLVPPLSGEARQLAGDADRALSSGDKAAAAELLDRAAAAAEDPRQKEDLRIRRLWLLYDLGKLDEVRRLAREIEAHAVRDDARRTAEELLAKLEGKGAK